MVSLKLPHKKDKITERIIHFQSIILFGNWLDTMINFIDDILNILNLASPELPLFAGLLLSLRRFCSVLINSGWPLWSVTWLSEPILTNPCFIFSEPPPGLFIPCASIGWLQFSGLLLSIRNTTVRFWLVMASSRQKRPVLCQGWKNYFRNLKILPNQISSLVICLAALAFWPATSPNGFVFP